MKFPVSVICDRMPELEIPWIIRLWSSNHQSTRRTFIKFQIYWQCHNGVSNRLLRTTALGSTVLRHAVHIKRSPTSLYSTTDEYELSVNFQLSISCPGKTADNHELPNSISTSLKSSTSRFCLFNDAIPNTSQEDIYVGKYSLHRLNIII